MQFKILRRLAYGGMAEILLGTVGGRGRNLWVLKRILPHLRGRRDCLIMFAAEGSIGLRLNHPNVVRTYATIPEPVGDPAIVLEYIAGLTLAELLVFQGEPQRRLPLAEVATIGRDLAQALAYAHSQGVIHRDVTPSNVMVGEGGRIKLIDFGVARADDRAETLWPGCIKGKISYMSPQQALGEPVDARADQYALALVLWECLAGEPCFVRGSHFQTLTRVVHGQTRKLTDFRPELPARFVSTLDRALAFAPADRFSSMADFAQALAVFADGAESGRHTLAQKRAAGSCRRPARPLAAVPITKPLMSLSLPLRTAQLEL